MDVIDVVKTGVPFFNFKDSSTVCMFLVAMMSLAHMQVHMKMTLRWWELVLLQPGPLKTRKK